MKKPSHYKYTITVNQFAIIEHDLDIDFIDAAIFGMWKDFATTRFVKTMMHDGSVWYKFHWKLIPQQLPKIGITGRTACYNRMNNLSNAQMLTRHPENQKNRESWYKFGTKADLYTVHQSEHSVHQNEHKTGKNSQNTVHQSEHTVQIGEHTTVHQSEHDNTTINNNTNIDKYRKEIAGILPNIKASWPPSLQKSVFEFLEYRQTLPKKDRMKTQRGWNAKISSFDNMFTKFGESDTTGAIILSIEREWKNVSMDWFIRDKPKTKNLVQDMDTFILPDNLEKLFQKGKKEYESKEVSKRISYFKKEEFASWMVNGKNYEKKRDNGYLQKEIFGTIKDCINKLNTSPFHQRTTGRLMDFIISEFKTGSGNIKKLNR